METDHHLSENYLWNLTKDYFDKYGLMTHQIETFNNFIDHGISSSLEEVDITIDQKDLKYKAIFKNAYVPNPSIIDEDRKNRKLFPSEARNRDLNYDSPIYVDIDEIFDESGKIETINHTRIPIARTPIMLRSNKCNLSFCDDKEKIKNGECENDTGGYFIIKGKERVIVGQLRGVYNQPIIMSQKPGEKYKYVCDVRSMSEETGHSVSLSVKIGSDDRTIVFSLPNIKEVINVGIVFKALGFVDEKDIINIVDNNKPEVKKYLKYIIRDCYFVKTQKDALKYIGQYAIHIIKEESHESYALQVVENEILPHMGISSTIKEKASFLGSMISKLLDTTIGVRKEDDRDNYINKRVEMTGTLCNELFRTLFKRFVKKLKEDLEKKKQRPDIMSVITRNSSITAGLKHSFSVGNWGVQKNNYIRTGVSQVLARMNYGATLSHLRRIVIPIGKEGKNAKIRQPHTSQFMYICPNECFAENTPILLWDGSIKLAKNIVVGDYLIDDKGNPTRVRSTCSGFKTMYEVQQEKNNFMNYTVTDNHILTLKVRNHKKIRKNKNKFKLHWFDKNIFKNKTKFFSTLEEAIKFNNNITDDDIIDITIHKYLKLPENIKKQLFGFKSDGINWVKKDVELDPYILGMWLGDSNSDGYGFTTEDIELLEYWKLWAENNKSIVSLIPRKLTKKNKNVNYTYKNHQINDPNKFRPDITYTIGEVLKSKLEIYNLINNKHIPTEYLINDRDTRLKVLAGLIDTDGSVRSNGHEIRITQGPKNTQIIIDALFLAQSLGFCCHLNDGKSQWTHTYEDRRTEKRFSTYKELSITGEYLYQIPILLKRKKLFPFVLKNSITKCASYLQSRIKVVEKEFEPFVGWQLEGNGRFLLSDFTVTHNTPKYWESDIKSIASLKELYSVCFKIEMEHKRRHIQIAGTPC